MSLIIRGKLLTPFQLFFMKAIFNLIIQQPIFNAFVGLYNIIPDVGIVILIITVIIKLILYPLTSSSIKAQKSLSELQPKLEALKKDYKDNKQQLAQETMKLYKEHKVNPLGSCLPLLIQLPIFLALYWVLQAALKSNGFETLYPFIQNPGAINTVSFGLFDLAKPHIILAGLAGAAQFWQAKMFTRKKPPVAAGVGGKDEGMASMMNKQMLYVMPVMTVFIGAQLPAGLTLYWLFSTLLTVFQQLVLFKKDGTSADKKVIEGKLVE